MQQAPVDSIAGLPSHYVNALVTKGSRKDAAAGGPQ